MPAVAVAAVVVVVVAAAAVAAAVQVMVKLASDAADGEKAVGVVVVDPSHSAASDPEVQADLPCSFVEPAPAPAPEPEPEPALEPELDAGSEPAPAHAPGVVLERSAPSEFLL